MVMEYCVDHLCTDSISEKNNITNRFISMRRSQMHSQISLRLVNRMEDIQKYFGCYVGEESWGLRMRR
jgi:hypothetical protein